MSYIDTGEGLRKANPTYTKPPKLTRVEVILKSGRAYSKWLTNTHFTISIQDDGKTIKLFEE